MKIKKLYELQPGDYIRIKKTDEYFLITGVHRFSVFFEKNYIELQWIYVQNFGKVYTKALKKIFQFDSESKNYILTFEKENDHYE